MDSLSKLLKEISNNKEEYTLHELFQIRDTLKILQKYTLADLELLKEVEKYIKQRGED